jgi:hypothetical protein
MEQTQTAHSRDGHEQRKSVEPVSVEDEKRSPKDEEARERLLLEVAAVSDAMIGQGYEQFGPNSTLEVMGTMNWIVWSLLG